MKLTTIALADAVLAVFSSVLLAAGQSDVKTQTSVPAVHSPSEDTAAKQQAAIALMRESIAKQRVSVQKQEGRSAEGFFLLAPPDHMEGMVRRVGELECPPLSDGEVRSLTGQAATREGLDQELLVNVMRQESGFRPCAVSAKGAQGLMQLMPSTAVQLGVRDPLDPTQNVEAGARFLRELLTRYNGDVLKAVSAYNAGPARVDAANGVPQIPETIDYINRIFYPGFEK